MIEKEAVILGAIPVVAVLLLYRIVKWGIQGEKGGVRRALAWLNLFGALFYSAVVWFVVWFDEPGYSDVGIPADFGQGLLIVAWVLLLAAHLAGLWIIAEIGLWLDRRGYFSPKTTAR